MTEETLNGIELIRMGKAKLQLQVADWIGKDAKVDKLMSGDYNIPEFLATIKDTDPYVFMEVSDGAYSVHKKEAKMHPMARLKSTAVQKVWDNIPLVKQVYPEMTTFLDALVQEVGKASCTGCAKNGKAHTIFQEMTYYDSTARDLEPIKEMAGRLFVRELKANPPVARPPLHRPQNQPPRAPAAQPQATTPNQAFVSSGKSPRPSCFSCARKHLGQAIVLLGEAKMGYPDHRWLAVAHLAEASEETLEYPEVAVVLRTERLNIMDNPEYTPNLMPYFSLIDNAEKGIPSTPK
jgi:hypothetical protein